jgi:hypothetical protein
LVCANRGESSATGVDIDVATMLDAGLTVVVVVDGGVEIAGVTGSVVVVVVVVGDGMTTPEGGNETTPIGVVSVGPFGWLRGTKTIPRIPATIKARETAHHIICEGRFPFCDFTSPNLVWLIYKTPSG